MPRWRRRKYLINKKVQLGYFGLTVWFICIGIMLVGSITYYLVFSTILKEFENVEKSIDIVNTVQRVNALLAGKLGITFIVLVILAAILVVYYLHRVVGPVFRIEKVLKEMMAGKQFEPIHLRKKDSFKSLADVLNAFLGRYEEKRNKILSILEKTDISDQQKISEINEVMKH
jgi:methyl-accepting chemotaxis protein